MNHMRAKNKGLPVVGLIGLAALIGCQVAPPTGPDSPPESVTRPTSGTATTKTGQTGGSQTVTLPANTATNTAQPALSVPAGGTDVLPDQFPSRAVTLASAKSLAVKAVEGALYRSADGRLEAVIPPQALTANADVRFAAVDTTGVTATAVMTPGIMFAMDLGAAELKAGAAIMVKAQVDQRFVDEITASLPNADLSKAGLTRDAKGTWFLTMPVKGIAGNQAERLQTNPLGDDLATVELRVAPATRKLLQVGDSPSVPAAEPTLTPEDTGDAVVNDFPGMPVASAGLPDYQPITVMKVSARKYVTNVSIRNDLPETLGAAHEYLHCFVGHGWCKGETVYGAIETVIRFNTAVRAKRQPPDALRDAVKRFRRTEPFNCTTGSITTTLQIKALYESDDSRVDGLPATDATISSNVSGFVNHEGVDDKGLTDVSVGVGKTVLLSGWIDIPEFAESAVTSVTALVGTPPIAIRIPKNSPRIVLALDSDTTLPSDMVVSYTLDGEQRTNTVTIPAGSGRSADASFFALVPDDNDHALVLGGVRSDTHADSGQPPIGQAFQVHRNGKYRKSVKVQFIAPK